MSDSYLAACEKADDGAIATLSVIDLSKVDKVVESFNTFAKSMYEASSNSVTFSAMSKRLVKIENFGGNNKSDGFTNMVDYGGLLTACADYTTGSAEALAALKDCVIYTVHGSDHPNASGLAIYYPLEVQSKDELTTFENICLSPYYLSYVDKKTQGFVSAGEDYEYEDDTWFPGGFWSWLTDYDEDDEGDYVYEEQEDEYWTYLENGEATGQSPYITFYEEPQVDENGVYYFVLDDQGYENAADVIAYVYTLTSDGAWDGIGANGVSSRNIVKIGTGDTIIPLYYSYDWDDEESAYYGDEYDVEGKLIVEYAQMYEGEYLYSFCIDDVYGDYYMTDPVAFYVGEDGEVMFGD